MMSAKKRTIDAMKEKREVSPRTRALVKEFNKNKKLILGAIRAQPKTVPVIAEETGLAVEDVLFHLMTLLKYGDVEVDRMDEMDEYYFYKVTGDPDDEDQS
jgi:predicted Rossmann fold nucleotide-binding protein DprA/Smf involved in DNA uptake